MKILQTKRLAYQIIENGDGTILVTKDGVNSINNAGAFIMCYGGVEKVIENCIEYDGTLEQFNKWDGKASEKEHEEWLAKKRQVQENMKRAEIERGKKRANERIDKYNNLLNNSKDGVIETTYKNIGIVLAYLNTQNWGAWDLPKMSIGYKCNQYDCDGKLASTMVLDEPISDEETGVENETRFQFGAPFGHLVKYRRTI